MRVLTLTILAACFGVAYAGEAQDWKDLDFLIGDWTGEGTGVPGQGSGGFSFQQDLQGKVLVRRNRAEYPASKDRSAFVHDDLMVVYREESQPAMKAVYFDSEQHAIRYDVNISRDRGEVMFLSAPLPNQARYRLTYLRDGADRVKIRFEIAPPGHTDQFSTYIEAAASRKK